MISRRRERGKVSRAVGQSLKAHFFRDLWSPVPRTLRSPAAWFRQVACDRVISHLGLHDQPLRSRRDLVRDKTSCLAATGDAEDIVSKNAPQWVDRRTTVPTVRAPFPLLRLSCSARRPRDRPPRKVKAHFWRIAMKPIEGPLERYVLLGLWGLPVFAALLFVGTVTH